jgi:hypothetical protein
MQTKTNNNPSERSTSLGEAKLNHQLKKLETKSRSYSIVYKRRTMNE